ncbi:MAG: ATP-dependent DNA ligase [Candidatus Woesearchaeota archaeon]
MEYIKLVETYEKIQNTSKRLEKIHIISEFIKQIVLKNNIDNKKELEIIINLLQGKIFQPWQKEKIGVSTKTVIKAIATSFGIRITTIENLWRTKGDLGIVAEELNNKKKQSTLFKINLDIFKIYNNLKKLASIEGIGTFLEKNNLINELLTSSTPKESKYIVRTILEDLRVGVGEGILRDSILWAFFGDELKIKYDDEKNIIVFDDNNREKYDEYSKLIQKAYNITNDFSKIIKIIKQDKIDGIKKVSIELGKPIKSMLFQKAKDIKDGFKIVGKPAAFEYKYDGFRIQIHYNDGEIILFSRNLENITKQFPDVVRYVKESITTKNAILDAEIVGINLKNNQYMPFQSISQRIKRKNNIDEMAKKFPVEINVFDIMFCDDKILLDEPFSIRRKYLSKVIEPKIRKIVLSRIIITDNEEEANKFYNEALDLGEEGVMIKNLNAVYEPGSRVGYGVKLKPIMDSLDLVIVEAEWGEGKRTNSLTSFTLACINENNELLKIGKVSTGLKELESEGVTYSKMTEILKPLILNEKGRVVILKPKIVIEVSFEEIQKSTNYESGYALRFPRFIRLREDKGIDNVNNLNSIKENYFSQRNRNTNN